MTDEPFDFNAELDKLVSGGSSSEPASGECLISKEPLGQTKISLECGHAFNYVPLLNEVVKQKCGHRTTEVVKLRLNQVKCPYCRNIQNLVLPYCPSLEPRRMVGVNAPAKWGDAERQVYACRCEQALKELWDPVLGPLLGNVLQAAPAGP